MHCNDASRSGCTLHTAPPPGYVLRYQRMRSWKAAPSPLPSSGAFSRARDWSPRLTAPHGSSVTPQYTPSPVGSLHVVKLRGLLSCELMNAEVDHALRVCTMHAHAAWH